jgi:hypothetical protein
VNQRAAGNAHVERAVMIQISERITAETPKKLKKLSAANVLG